MVELSSAVWHTEHHPNPVILPLPPSATEMLIHEFPIMALHAGGNETKHMARHWEANCSPQCSISPSHDGLALGTAACCTQSLHINPVLVMAFSHGGFLTWCQDVSVHADKSYL